MAVVKAGIVPHYPWTLAAAGITCALAPAYTIRWRLGFYPSTALEVAIVTTVLVFLLEMRRQRAHMELWSPISIPIVLLLCAGAISVLVAPDHRAGLGLYRAYFIEPCAFFLVLTEVIRTPRTALWIIGGLFIAVLLIGVPNVAVTLSAIRDGSLDVSSGPPVVIYESFNSVALFEVPVLALAASLLVYGTDRVVRIVAAGFLLFSVPAVLLTFSRGGYLAFFAVAVGLALSHRRRWWILAGILVAAVAVTRIGLIQERIAHELSFSDPSNSLVTRLQLWRATLEALKASPVFGGGISGFEQAIRPYRGWYTRPHPYPHNIFLDFWIETGILGLSAFVWIMVLAARSAWHGWRSASFEWRPVHLGVGLALVATLVHGMVDSPYWKNDLSLLFWVLVGLTWAGRRWAHLGSDAPLRSASEAGEAKGFA